MNILFGFVSFLLLKSLYGSSGCNHRIFCIGSLLETVQMSGIFKDSKTFVDLNLVNSVEYTLQQFDILLTQTNGKPSKDDVMTFLQTNFEASNNELENWFPTDFKANPPFLKKILNPQIKAFATHLINLWPILGRKVKQEVINNSPQYSIIPIPNGFIIPGGRFREYYYWDSYWIIRGLLICEMRVTAKGMIENFFKVIDQFGFVPSGGRIYYLDRSHPPLLTMMVEELMVDSFEPLWLKKNIAYIETELKYWLTRKIVHIKKNDKMYTLARYCSSDDSPRPESYKEDVETAARYQTDDEKRACYLNIRTAAETGWDFSKRWFFDENGGNEGDLSTSNPTRILPVDLNAILCKSFQIMYKFHTKLHNKEKAFYWLQKWTDWMEAIDDVLYNKEDGTWYDYDIELNTQRKYFYASNLAPLWTESYNINDKISYGINTTKYLNQTGILHFDGGLPTSLFESGQQWDLPNAWAPMQGFVIFGLEKTADLESKKLAKEFADKWIESTIAVTNETHEFFEKYNAVVRGIYGAGGEYEVQTGFGWTNGVLLELIDYYYAKK